MAGSAENPILIVHPRESDLQQKEILGFGPPKEIVAVNQALRDQLAEQIHQVFQASTRKLERFPEIPCVITLKLRPEALAKTHRPMDLLERAGMHPIGTRNFGELLLPATAHSLANLQRIILNNHAKKIKANISTIEEFSPYSSDDVIHGKEYGNFADEMQEWLDQKKPVILERFASDDAEVDANIFEHINLLLKQHGVETIRPESRGAHKTFRLISGFGLKQLEALADSPAVRSLLRATEFAPIKITPQWFNVVGPISDVTIPPPSDDLPTVAVVDTGVAPSDTTIAPWVVDREAYLLPPDTDFLHGTFVAGLIAAGRPMNGNAPEFPDCQAKVLDVAALGVGTSTSMDDMLNRIEESIKRHPDVKVWNCSFGSKTPGSIDYFGKMATELDSFSDKYGVLFVIAAGNYETPPMRCWPTPQALHGDDRISQPAESVRALTVGSVAHLPALVAPGDPSPFSRRGPGPAKTPKPDITHRGGNCTTGGAFDGAGVRSIVPGDRLGESIGTSFSTPLASSMAANAWRALERQQIPVRPEIIKAMMIHAAALNSPKRTPDELNYYGFGVPESTADILFCTPETFTLMFDVELFDGQIWEKTPFPIPSCLHPNGDHFKGEIILTLVYAPPVDGRHNSEYVRANVNAHFGTYDPDQHGELHHKSILPLDSPDKTDLYEEAMIDHGFKWSPVKVYRATFARGKAGKRFRLYLDLLRRAGEAPRLEPQRAVVLVTMRALEPNPAVYNDGIAAVNSQQWATTRTSADLRIRTHT
ncbi:MAG: hypothetical protein D3M94_14350 [Rhodocyclales bacterium GT-UBC]|nr:MAG: hypothetical protein D3M94_14350 [Rhodocyclales bacterium GT-UBC]